MRIFALSDLHVDFAANLSLVESLSSSDYQQDVLLVAGDASHRLDRAEAALQALVDRFARVFFIAGNHDLWVDDGTADEAGGAARETSLDRLTRLDNLCAQLGVSTAAGSATSGSATSGSGTSGSGAPVWVIPLLSWYEDAFSARLHADAPSEGISRRWADHQRCLWPDGLGDDPARCRYFADRNADRLAPPAGARVITMSHFLPRAELLPLVGSLRFKQLPRVAGAEGIDVQLRAAGSSVHVFGHTHIPWDETIDGVRYVQNPLAYPHERKRRGQQGIRLVEL